MNSELLMLMFLKGFMIVMAGYVLVMTAIIIKGCVTEAIHLLRGGDKKWACVEFVFGVYLVVVFVYLVLAVIAILVR